MIRILPALVAIWLVSVSSVSAAPIYPVFGTGFGLFYAEDVLPDGYSHAEWAATGGGSDAIAIFDTQGLGEGITGTLRFDYLIVQPDLALYPLELDSVTRYYLPSQSGTTLPYLTATLQVENLRILGSGCSGILTRTMSIKNTSVLTRPSS